MLAARHGGFLVPGAKEFTDDDLSQTVCRVMSQVGNAAEAVSAAMMDRVITTHEADLIEREFQAALAAIGEWRANSSTSSR